MSGNRERAQADREAIRAVLAARTQAEPLLRLKDVLRILAWPDSKARAVRRHVDAIRARR